LETERLSAFKKEETMIPLDSVKELRRNLREVKSGCAGDTIFGAKALLFIAEKLEAITEKLEAIEKRLSHRRPRRKLSAWNKAFGIGAQQGLSAAETAAKFRGQNGSN
jgi:hypothetical protein